MTTHRMVPCFAFKIRIWSFSELPPRHAAGFGLRPRAGDRFLPAPSVLETRGPNPSKTVFFPDASARHCLPTPAGAPFGLSGGPNSSKRVLPDTGLRAVVCGPGSFKKGRPRPGPARRGVAGPAGASILASGPQVLKSQATLTLHSCFRRPLKDFSHHLEGPGSFPDTPQSHKFRAPSKQLPTNPQKLSRNCKRHAIRTQKHFQKLLYACRKLPQARRRCPEAASPCQARAPARPQMTTRRVVSCVAFKTQM